MDINKILDSIKGIEENSCNIKEDFIFFALPGLRTHGEKYIDQAIKRGAKYVIIDCHSEYNYNINDTRILKIDNPRKFLSKLLSIYYKDKPQNLVAVTGTNGKTSVVSFYQQICSLLNYQSASIGTLGVIESSQDFQSQDSVMTSPLPIKLHKTLKQLYQTKNTHVAIEASSHGIHQYRLDYLNFTAVGFTNFSQDHLDYHITLEGYLNTKLRIFREILRSHRYAVLNTDIDSFDIMNQICKNRKIRVIEYGIKAKEIRILSTTDTEWTINIFGKKYFIDPPVQGLFQLYNILCSIGLAIACNLSVDNIMNVATQIKPIKGRFDLVDHYNGANIYIDYAHTPESLRMVLSILRKLCKGNLHVLFGCGGERDKIKRKLMGSIANSLADYVVITDDNPRGEDPSFIRQQIMTCCTKGREIKHGRRYAIRYAMNNLQDHDILLIAGKGHEEYQIIGDSKIYFSDFEEVKNIAKKK